MKPRLRTAFLLLALLATPLLASSARSQILPVFDQRKLHAKATTVYGLTRDIELSPPASFGLFDATPVAQTYGNPSGEASATAYQTSQLYTDIAGNPNGFFHSGSTSGEFQVSPGTYEAQSYSTMVFQLATTSDVFIDATLDTGDVGSSGKITLGHPFGGPISVLVLSGHLQENVRLGPGDYFLEGRSQVSTLGESMQGPTYAIIMLVQPTNTPYIQGQPLNIVIPLGGSGSLKATMGSPAPRPSPEGTAAFVYQWKKNGALVTNGGHFSGATTNELTITSAATADSGWYQLFVTSGPITEPSRVVRVGVGVTGVDPVVPQASLDFRLDPATPNPSATSTTFRFRVAQPVQADAAVYDASGRRVRAISSGMLSGAGVLEWDGRSETGEHAPAGIYFLRVRVDGETFTRRFVRMRS